MQNEGSNGGHSCEQDLEKQGKSQEGLSVVGSGALALDRRLATQFLLSPEMSRWIQEFFFGCQNCLLMAAQLGKLINLQQLSLSSNRTCQAEKFYTIKNSREWTERTHSIIHLCSEKKLEQLRISDLSGSNHAFPELANLTSLTQIQGRAFQWEMWFNRRLHTEDWSLTIRFCGSGRSKAAFTLLYTMACFCIF